MEGWVDVRVAHSIQISSYGLGEGKDSRGSVHQKGDKGVNETRKTFSTLSFHNLIAYLIGSFYWGCGF